MSGVPELEDVAGADVLDVAVGDATFAQHRGRGFQVRTRVDAEADVVEAGAVLGELVVA